ncbi:hypothetical protein [Alloalcanivorax profundimaris]|uniref:hypothetical protein n=1 Tax=Alloalcanivorax profundimaris TaxID=2735259 RepID=UPI0018914ED0|nr:hypothetical protein [Alloalcanivorax profundimaris]
MMMELHCDFSFVFLISVVIAIVALATALLFFIIGESKGGGPGVFRGKNCTFQRWRGGMYTCPGGKRFYSCRRIDRPLGGCLVFINKLMDGDRPGAPGNGRRHREQQAKTAERSS